MADEKEPTTHDAPQSAAEAQKVPFKQRIRYAFSRVLAADKAAHEYIASRFPKTLAIVDLVSGAAYQALTNAIFGGIVAAVGAIMAFTGLVDIGVWVSALIAWLLALAAAAKVGAKLTLPTRLLLILLIGVVSGFALRGFSNYALRRYKEQQAKQSHPAPVVESRPAPILTPPLTATPSITLEYIPDNRHILMVEEGDVRIDSKYLQDRKQYRLTIKNDSEADFSDLKLRVQFPYPVEHFHINSNYEAQGVRFPPVGLDWEAGGSPNFGSVQIRRKPLSATYELFASELRKQRAKSEIVFILNTWRDPRGKVLPKGEEARYFVPESGPEITYINGSYKVKINGGEVENRYYAPIVLHDDKTISLGPPSDPPKELKLATGIQ